MDDKCIMENLLNNTKGACDLYMHGSIESPTANVHQAFTSALNETVTMEDSIYKQMETKGWYQAQDANQQNIQQVKQKYTANFK